MTRFQQEIKGSLGEYWRHSAEQELEAIKAAYADGEIKIDATGVARNLIGRVVMADMAEKIEAAGITFNQDATARAREKEVAVSIAEYQRSYRSPGAEDIAEMQNVHGQGSTVVDVLTGTKIKL